MNRLPMSFGVGIAGVALTIGTGATASPVGDDIAYTSPNLSGSPLPDLFTGPGYAAEPFLGPVASPDMVIDITTGTFLAGTYFGITYAFGVPPAGTPSPVAPATDVVTHDLEWVGMPGIPLLDVYFYSTPTATALGSFGGGFAFPGTAIDIDLSGSGFDAGITIATPGLLVSGDAYLILFGDPHLGTAVGPPPVITGFDLVGVVTIPAPGATTCLVLAGVVCLRRRR
ncbi:MAG: hypothetical protein ACF8GE_07150 [Phycisphaerales bacterium JB043]